MKRNKLMLGFVLSAAVIVPSVVAAQSSTPPSGGAESGAQTPPPSDTQAAPPSETPPPLPSETPPPQPSETLPSDTGEQAAAQGDAKMKGAIIPIVAGVQSAQLSSSAMRELVKNEPFQRADARRTLELTDQALSVGHERAQQLSKMKDLPEQAKTDLQTAVTQLKTAKNEVDNLERQVGRVEGMFRRDEIDRLRTDLPRLDSALADARKSIDKIAQQQGVSTDFSTEAPEPPPAMGK